MSLAALTSVPPAMLTQGFAELTVEVRDHVHDAFSAAPGGLDGLAARLDAAGHPFRGPVEHDGGDRSVHVEDPEGNLVEVWDFFERGEGRREGAAALAAGDIPPNDASS
jgi:catechol 2,3-dioxygenase-like lactoylglutathione lyase family enzyme